jgi:hypothetical protein
VRDQPFLSELQFRRVWSRPPYFGQWAAVSHLSERKAESLLRREPAMVAGRQYLPGGQLFAFIDARRIGSPPAVKGNVGH